MCLISRGREFQTEGTAQEKEQYPNDLVLITFLLPYPSLILPSLADILILIFPLHKRFSTAVNIISQLRMYEINMEWKLHVNLGPHAQ